MPRRQLTDEEFAKQQSSSPSKKNQYQGPSKWALDRIAKIPAEIKSELKRIYGIDIDALAKDQKKYGIVEMIAGNNFTLYPELLEINVAEHLKKEFAAGSGVTQEALSWIPNLGTTKGFYTFRFWMIPSSGQWGVKLHEAKLGPKLDDEAEAIKKEDGTDKMTWNRNELGINDSLKYQGKYLSKDQMDHLRLTGTLGEPIQKNYSDGSSLYVCLYVDDYNHHELIEFSADDSAPGKKSNYVRLQLESKMKDSGNIFYMGGEPYWLEDDAVKAAANGGYVWAYGASKSPDNPKEYIVNNAVRVNVWFDPRTRNFRPTIASDPKKDFEQALREEKTRIKEANEQKKASLGQTTQKGKTQKK